MNSCVCASTPGVMRRSARAISPVSAWMASIRAISSKLSMTMRPYTRLHRGKKFGTRLVVAVKYQVTRRDSGRPSHMKLAQCRNVEVHAFLVGELGHSHTQKRLGCIGNPRAKDLDRFATPGAKMLLVVHKERACQTRRRVRRGRHRRRSCALQEKSRCCPGVDDGGRALLPMLSAITFPGVPTRQPDRKPARSSRCEPLR